MDGNQLIAKLQKLPNEQKMLPVKYWNPSLQCWENIETIFVGVKDRDDCTPILGLSE